MAPAIAIFAVTTASAIRDGPNRHSINCAPLPSALFLREKESEGECAGYEAGFRPDGLPFTDAHSSDAPPAHICQRRARLWV